MVSGIGANKDALIEIDKELILFALALFAQTAADPWLQCHKEISPNLVAIENLRPTTGILIYFKEKKTIRHL
jgi:hypothetical protein